MVRSGVLKKEKVTRALLIEKAVALNAPLCVLAVSLFGVYPEDDI